MANFSNPALGAELRRRDAPALCGASAAAFAKAVGRPGGACVERARRRVGGLACEMTVWQHEGHALVELVDVAAEGHHRPSLAGFESPGRAPLAYAGGV